MSLSSRARNLNPSPTLAMTTKAAQMRREGIDVISFSAGEPDFDTPDNIKQAAIEAIQSGFTKYTPVAGTPELKEAVCKKFARDNGLNYEPSQVIVSCGGKHVIYNALQVLCEEGDEVIIPSPYWVSYPEQVKLTSATPVIIETKEDKEFRLDTKALKQKITDKTKVMILNSPCNPTGAVYDKNTLEQIAELAVAKGMYVISDELYEEIIYDGNVHYSIASFGEDIKNLTIMVNGVSKAYAMTGWRIGYGVGPEEVIKAMSKLQGQSTSNPTSISQKAVIEALNGPQDTIEMMVAEFDKRRRYIVDRVNAIPGISCLLPKGAFYVFPNIAELKGRKYKGETITNSSRISDFLLEEARIATVPGVGFGADDYIRISYATSMSNIEKGLDRMQEALRELE